MRSTAISSSRRKPGSRRTMNLPRPAVGRLASHAVADGLVLAFIGAWWLTARSLPSYVLPSPLATLRALVLLFVDPAFLGDTLISLARILLAVALAIILGGALAALGSYVPSSSYAIQRRVMPVLNSFPSIGWALLAAFWFQPGNFSVLFVEVLILVPFCAIALAQGIADMDRELIEMGESFSRSRWRIALKIVLPLLLPYLMSSVRIAY